jgi:hypothetical protein
MDGRHLREPFREGAPGTCRGLSNNRCAPGTSRPPGPARAGQPKRGGGGASACGYARNEREARANPSKVPVSLWEMRRRYHQAVRDLCVVYQPDWVSGLDERIAKDDEIVRRLKPGG